MFKPAQHNQRAKNKDAQTESNIISRGNSLNSGNCRKQVEYGEIACNELQQRESSADAHSLTRRFKAMPLITEKYINISKNNAPDWHLEVFSIKTKRTAADGCFFMAILLETNKNKVIDYQILGKHMRIEKIPQMLFNAAENYFGANTRVARGTRCWIDGNLVYRNRKTQKMMLALGIELCIKNPITRNTLAHAVQHEILDSLEEDFSYDTLANKFNLKERIDYTLHKYGFHRNTINSGERN